MTHSESSSTRENQSQIHSQKHRMRGVFREDLRRFLTVNVTLIRTSGFALNRPEVFFILISFRLGVVDEEFRRLPAEFESGSKQVVNGVARDVLSLVSRPSFRDYDVMQDMVCTFVSVYVVKRSIFRKIARKLTEWH